MKKKFINILLSIVMVIAVLQSNKLTVLAEEYGDFRYSIEDDAVVITGYTGNADTVEIPAYIDGKPVVKINPYAFAYAGEWHIIIPDTVTTIEWRAFEYANILSVTIPESVTLIGERAFTDTKNLTSVTIPCDNVTIGDSAFRNSSAIEYVTITGSNVTIEAQAFSYGANLRTVNITGDDVSIGNSAFFENYKLETVTLSGNNMALLYGAFARCGSINTVEITGDDVSIGSSAFSNCHNLHTVEITGDDVSIGPSAFSNCHNLHSIILPSSVTEIGYQAFEGIRITIYCEEGSAAQAFCDKYDILYYTGMEPGITEPEIKPFFDPSVKNPVYTTIRTTAKTDNEGYGLTPWASESTVQTVVNPNGNISVLNLNLDNSGKFYIYEYTITGEFIKEVGFTPAFDTIGTWHRDEIGAFAKDKAGNYYISYGRDVTDMENREEQVPLSIVKYSPDGVQLMDFSPQAKEIDTIDGLTSGASRLEISGNRIAALYERALLNSHGLSDIVILDINTFEWLSNPANSNIDLTGTDIVTRSGPWVGHCMFQFLLPRPYGNFMYVAQGDAYPRTFHFMAGRSEIDSFQFYAFSEGMENDTYAELGGAAITPDGYLFLGTYNRGLPAEAVRNMFFQTIDKELSSISDPTWITDYASSSRTNVVAPKIVQIKDNQYLIMWMTSDTDQKPTGTYSMIVDGNGNVLSPQQELKGVYLSRFEPIRYNRVNGLVYWAVNVIGEENAIRLYAYDPLTQTENQFGDVNSDGKVDLRDATLVMQYYAKIIDMNDLDLSVADVNGDGEVDLRDATLIMQYYAKLIDHLGS
jgi:hypothetical protein